MNITWIVYFNYTLNALIDNKYRKNVPITVILINSPKTAHGD